MSHFIRQFLQQTLRINAETPLFLADAFFSSYLLKENNQNITTNKIIFFFPVQVWLSRSVLYNYCGIFLLLAHPVQEWIYWREKERGGRFGNLWSRKSSLVSCCFHGHTDTHPLQRRPLPFLRSPSMELLSSNSKLGPWLCPGFCSKFGL